MPTRTCLSIVGEPDARAWRRVCLECGKAGVERFVVDAYRNDHDGQHGGLLWHAPRLLPWIARLAMQRFQSAEAAAVFVGEIARFLRVADDRRCQ